MRITESLPFFRRVIRRISTDLLAWSENRDDARMDRNGEAWLLGALASDWAGADRSITRVVFDVGANRGDFTAAILAAADNAAVRVTVYAFEPNPEVAADLTRRFARDPRVRIVEAAVSDVEGTAPLFGAAGGSECASLVRRNREAPDAPPLVPLITLAAFLESSAVGRVDLLKLDIEGAELSALRGLGRWLTPATVPVVLFEYGGTTLDAGHRLRDFFDLFQPTGYRVAKLFPRWADVRTYEARYDNFYYSNWLAIPASPTGQNDG